MTVTPHARPHDSRHHPPTEVYPPFGLRIVCGDLVLRGITDGDVMALVEVAR